MTTSPASSPFVTWVWWWQVPHWIDWDILCKVLGTVLGTRGTQGVLVLLFAWGGRRRPILKAPFSWGRDKGLWCWQLWRGKKRPCEKQRLTGTQREALGGPGASQPGISKDRALAKPARTLHGLHSGGRAKGERRVPAQNPLSGPVPPGYNSLWVHMAALTHLVVICYQVKNIQVQNTIMPWFWFYFLKKAFWKKVHQNVNSYFWVMLFIFF